MIDSDLATIYGVPTGAFNRAIKRNRERFPKDFAFQLSRLEFETLRCQIGILKIGRGRHRKYLPYVFTEHGAIMAANVLNSVKERGSHGALRSQPLNFSTSYFEPRRIEMGEDFSTFAVPPQP